MTAQYLQNVFHDLVNNILLSPWVLGPAVVVLWLVILLPAKKKILSRSRRYLAGRTNWAWVEALIDALGPTISIIIVAGAIALLAWILPLSWRAERTLYVMIVGAVVLALMIFTDRICRGLLVRLASRSAAL